MPLIEVSASFSLLKIILTMTYRCTVAQTSPQCSTGLGFWMFLADTWVDDCRYRLLRTTVSGAKVRFSRRHSATLPVCGSTLIPFHAPRFRHSACEVQSRRYCRRPQEAHRSSNGHGPHEDPAQEVVRHPLSLHPPRTGMPMIAWQVYDLQGPHHARGLRDPRRNEPGDVLVPP